MRGIVAPSTPCWPRTSVAALRSLRHDSRLRACCGSRFFVIGFFGIASFYSSSEHRRRLCPAQKTLDTLYNVNVNLHLHFCYPEEFHGYCGCFPSVDFIQTAASVAGAELPPFVDRQHRISVRRSVLSGGHAVGNPAAHGIGCGYGHLDDGVVDSASRLDVNGRSRSEERRVG